LGVDQSPLELVGITGLGLHQENDIPYNPLHDKGFLSIGCSCCTRAVAAGEDVRAGRWWWEQPEHKECGLHRKGVSRTSVE
jgi:3'-phosphoadenosine 5'-phosphosulfate sulfotransferase (PAPS reductase)/FAD synthetase